MPRRWKANSQAATYLSDLEELAGHQSRQLDHMEQALARLQAVTLQLRTDRWQEAVPAEASAATTIPESQL